MRRGRVRLGAPRTPRIASGHMLAHIVVGVIKPVVAERARRWGYRIAAPLGLSHRRTAGAEEQRRGARLAGRSSSAASDAETDSLSAFRLKSMLRDRRPLP